MKFKGYIITILVTLVSWVQPVSATGEEIGVIYPDMREPYRSIFTNIIDGIRDTAGNEVKLLAVSTDDEVDTVSQWIEQNNIDSLIALGSRSQKLAAKTDIENKVVGAIIKPPEDNGFQAGLLLTPDPNKMFENLKLLVPNINKIYVVYSQQHSGWYIDIAKMAARQNGLELEAVVSESKRDSITTYKEILDSDVDQNSAVWLLQDPLSSDRRIILPLVLELAWEKKIPVISNRAGHVERGALLALYPDHFELGISLAQMSINNQLYAQKYAPFTEALNAANTRTADHLDLNWSRKTKRSINLVFPRR